MAQEGDKPVEEYKTLWGARILWPADIPDNMCEDAVKTAMSAFEEYGKQEKECLNVAKKIKNYFDEKYDPYWHVTVGKNFGCHAVHEKQRFIYFYIDQFAFLIYKAQ
mmetsp:Transcript_51629/g.109705  ORF Transcript_51629/g.109705 Transcript_51629/m.109705 type:complete len:107 (+) Transcript_51629:96-416(+)|eukprot:CAMPEP_0206446230 /NCGR_PEP_ID=MMETSP0324_2-20121206/16006_1 /ASSEMBLY_ACC=CAM_ASM_000836 /TAXON_ID=2866 /ORGANISM="Crypthecodinium cohnii, Strain Seligo" /LENGTH=106 /DNA_ID=CAMNT_0053914649 /DNA_START=47 /DNA_END=367 /DNA_ORIENTATION=-